MPSWQLYAVKSGDTAWKIAHSHYITLPQLKVLNPQDSSIGSLYVGQKIRISGNVHTVKNGETAWKIANNNGMTISDLNILNPQDGSLGSLYVGETLYVR
nr:LysM peptidoglycan-binding domain-containing protein [Scopulibacillus darangshiensis]